MSETDKPVEVTIVTIKGIEVPAWQRARKCAAANDEMMGPWISRAANLLADRQEQNGLFPPGVFPDKPNPPPDKPNPPAELNLDALQTAVVATEMAQRILGMPVARPVKAEAQRILDMALLATQGLPPRDRPVGLPRTVGPGRSETGPWKARLEAADHATPPAPDGSGRVRQAPAAHPPAGSPASG